MITSSSRGLFIDVRVVPRSSRPGIDGRRGDALLVRLSAPPVEGAANAELIEVMARALGVAKGAVRIVSGAQSKQKRVLVTGISASEADARLR